MGKTSLALNVAQNAAKRYNARVGVFSLEMSKEQLTYRLLAMEVGIESGRLRTGRLQQEEWPLLGQGISTLGLSIDGAETSLIARRWPCPAPAHPRRGCSTP